LNKAAIATLKLKRQEGNAQCSDEIFKISESIHKNLIKYVTKKALNQTKHSRKQGKH
jgi:hypothetical protein